MIRCAVVAVVAVALIAACAPSGGAAKQTLSQAEVSCVQPANQFARRPLPVRGEGGARVGLLAEYPEDYHVQAFYKRCVRARSGQRTQKRVNWRL